MYKTAGAFQEQFQWLTVVELEVKVIGRPVLEYDRKQMGCSQVVQMFVYVYVC